MDTASTLLLVVVLFWGMHKWSRSRAADNARLIYLTNVKQALQSFGFIGSPGDVDEDPQLFDSFFYLKGLGRFNSKLKRLTYDGQDEQSKLWVKLTEFSGDSPEFEVNDDENNYKFQITFSAKLDDQRSKGILSLSVYDDAGSSRYPVTLCTIVAPAYSFNRANLSLYLDRFAMDVVRYAKEGDGAPYWLVSGVADKELQRACGLPLLLRESRDRSWKNANKIMKKGYSHLPL